MSEGLVDNQTLALQVSQTEVPIPTSNRLVVFGSRLSGAFELAASFQSLLQERDITNPNVEVHRDAGYVEQAFYGLENGPILPGAPKTLPRGVIVLPEMRQYDPDSGNGMFLPTYISTDVEGRTIFENIQALCEKHDVPLSRFELSGIDEISEGIVQLLMPPESIG